MAFARQLADLFVWGEIEECVQRVACMFGTIVAPQVFILLKRLGLRICMYCAVSSSKMMGSAQEDFLQSFRGCLVISCSALSLSQALSLAFQKAREMTKQKTHITRLLER